MNPNWLGEATVSIPNNTIVVNGVPVNAVANIVGASSNVTSWANANFVTFFTASNVNAGTYLVGCETFCDPLTASNAGNGWNQGDYFVGIIRDKDNTSTLYPSVFHRPYTNGIQVSATSPYNKGSTDLTTCGILVVTSNTDIVWSAQFGKDVATSYPQTRKLTMESPWFQKIA
jgi:hypothetical protein